MKTEKQWLSRHFFMQSLALWIVFSFLLLVISSCQGLQKSVFAPSTDRLAKEQKYRYMANHAVRNGKPPKALKSMKKVLAITDEPDKTLNALARLYMEANEPAQALRFLKRCRKTADAMTPKKKVQLLNWEGGYALSKQLPKRALELFDEGLELLAKHEIKDDLLAASLENNRGVAELFDQGFTTMLDTLLVGGNHKVHINDIHRARTFFERSLFADPTGTAANHNLALMNKILVLPRETRTRYKGYIPNSFIEQMEVSTGELLGMTESLDSMAATRKESQQQEKYAEMLQLLRDKDEILFLLDISGSMNAKVATGSVVTRFESMLNSVETLVTWLPKDKKIGLLTIGGGCGQDPIMKLPVENGNRLLILNTLKGLRPSGGTPLYDRLRQSSALFSSEGNEKTIFLASDGLESCLGALSTCELASQLCQQGINITVLSLLLDKRSSFNAYGTYQCLASPCGGALFGITDVETIESKDNLIRSDYYSFRVHKRDLMNGVFNAVSMTSTPLGKRKGMPD